MAQRRLEENRIYTANEFMEIAGSRPDMELIEGKLTAVCAAAWNTSKLTARLISYLTVYAESRDLGSVWGIDGSFRIEREPETVVMPDIAFLLPHRMEDVILDTFFEGSPDLAVEVRSPSDRMADLSKKMDRYLDAGTEMTWLIDPPRRQVHVRHRGDQIATVLGGDDVLRGEPLVPGFALPLPILFEIFARPRFDLFMPGQ